MHIHIQVGGSQLGGSAVIGLQAKTYAYTYQVSGSSTNFQRPVQICQGGVAVNFCLPL